IGPVLEQWRTAMPEESEAAVERQGDRFAIASCDPGPEVDQHIRGTPSDALALPAVRLYVLGSAIAGEVSFDDANCIAHAFTDRITVEEARGEGDADPEIARRIAEARAACE